jgi:protein dithiol oxidoreductase (disulfide-forming)
MIRFTASVLAVVVLALPAAAGAATTFSEGSDYVLVTPAQQTTVPKGKIEVMEVFSYGCPVCNAFQPTMDKLRRSLPANAQVVYLPASFNNTAEDWPMFQRAYFAAQFLGVAERAHQAMFDAVWKTGELATSDYSTNRLKEKQPTIEQAASFYARVTGVDPQKFLAMANSFGVDSKMRAADAQIIAMHVSGTPTLIVNGKYRVTRDWRPSSEQFIELIKYLVAKDSAAAP